MCVRDAVFHGLGEGGCAKSFPTAVEPMKFLNSGGSRLVMSTTTPVMNFIPKIASAVPIGYAKRKAMVGRNIQLT